MPPPAPAPGPASVARQAGLRYVCDAQPGITRRRAGRGFTYREPDGTRVTDRDLLARIRALAIPPAWTDVWICRQRNGHLQATGRDARGRKQYRYHADWHQVRGAGKFDRITAFGRALPDLRRRLRTDLRQRGFPRSKVIAIVVALLADTLVRVGNDAYLRENRSYGLTTLRNRHVAFLRGGRARLKFRGKGGAGHEVELDDRRLVRLVRRVQQLPGQALFQYRDDDGELQPVDSGEVNAYLHGAMGEAFSAKDFRTWGGTLAAFRALADTPLPEGRDGGQASERAVAGVLNDVVREVARQLGNTPAVCRKAYIDPVVFDAWREGRLSRYADAARGPRQWEHAALRLLRAEHRRRPAPRDP